MEREVDSNDLAAGHIPAALEEDDVLPSEELPPDVVAVQRLFSGCLFYCARETPIAALEFVILSCGGAVVRDGDASTMAESNEAITHQAFPCFPAL